MVNTEITIEALTKEVATLKSQHCDEIERVCMERREAEISMTDQLSALMAFVFDNKHQGNVIIEMLEDYVYALARDLKKGVRQQNA